MSIRQSLNRNKRLAAGLVLVVIAGAVLAHLLWRPGEAETVKLPARLWYFDLQTGRLFADRVDQVPPFVNQAGHESVLATVFSCTSSCDGKDLEGKTPDEVEKMGLHVGYFQRLGPSARQSVEAYRKKAAEPGHVLLQCMQRLAFEGEYRTVADANWKPTRSQEFVRLGGAIQERCPGALECRPVP